MVMHSVNHVASGEAGSVIRVLNKQTNIISRYYSWRDINLDRTEAADIAYRVACRVWITDNSLEGGATDPRNPKNQHPNCKFCENPGHAPDIFDAPEDLKDHIKHLIAVLRSAETPKTVDLLREQTNQIKIFRSFFPSKSLSELIR